MRREVTIIMNRFKYGMYAFLAVTFIALIGYLVSTIWTGSKYGIGDEYDVISKNLRYRTDLVFDNDRVFYINRKTEFSQNQSLLQLDADGNVLKHISSDTPVCQCLDGNQLYYALDNILPSITGLYRYDLQTGDTEKLSGESVSDLAVCQGQLYYTKYVKNHQHTKGSQFGEIFKLDLSTHAVTQLTHDYDGTQAEKTVFWLLRPVGYTIFTILSIRRWAAI